MPYVDEDQYDEATDGGVEGPLSWENVKSVIPDKWKALIGGLLGLFGALEWDLDAFADHPVRFVVTRIENAIIDYLVNPVFAFVIDVFETLAESALYIAFGQDRMLGVYTSLGVLDIPMYIVLQIIDAVRPAGDAMLGVLEDVNLAIASVAAEAGFTAPVLVPGLWLAEIAVAGWLAMTVVSAIDIPGVRVVPFVNRLFAPVRAFFRRLR